MGPDDALPGRDAPIRVPARHEVLGTPLEPPVPRGPRDGGLRHGLLLGRGADLLAGARASYSTAVGYAGGHTPNPTYEEVCSARTGHAEVVLVVFDPAVTSYEEMLRLFWEGHDPTQGMRQGNDVGTQYRSAIYTTSEAQAEAAERSRETYRRRAGQGGLRQVTTEIAPLGDFFYAEDYHQQYLAKVPNGYCGLGGTGVSCPVGLGTAAPAGS